MPKVVTKCHKEQHGFSAAFVNIYAEPLEKIGNLVYNN